MFRSNKKIQFENEQEEIEAITIEHLFDEVLVEIFSFLDAKSLRIAALVCKKWDQLIGSSAMTMDKFQLRMCDYLSDEILPLQKFDRDIRKFDFNFCSARKHQNVYLSSRGDAVRALNNFNLSQVRTFIIHMYELTNFELLWTIISSLSMLKCLTFFTFKSEALGSFNAPQLNLPRLTKLRIYNQTGNPFQLIKADNIKYFSCRNIEDPHRILSFLKSCEELESLILYPPAFAKLLAVDNLLDVKFELTYFQTFSALDSVIHAKKVSKFLLSQAGSLTKLSIVDGPSIWRDIYMVIFMLRKLTTLHIYGKDFAYDSAFYAVEPLTSVKVLKTYMHQMGADRFGRFFMKFPNIDTLSLILTESQTLSDVDIDFLLQKLPLRHVTFTGAENQLKPIFNKVKTNYAQLKTMTLLFTEWQTDNLVFKFPDDPSKWIVQEQEEKFSCRRVF